MKQNSEKQTVNAMNFGITIFPYFKPKGEKYLALEFFARTYLTPQPKNISIKGKYYCIMHIFSKNIAKSFRGMVTWQSKNKSEEMAPRKPPLHLKLKVNELKFRLKCAGKLHTKLRQNSQRGGSSELQWLKALNMNFKLSAQLSYLRWILNSVSKWFDLAMRLG